MALQHVQVQGCVRIVSVGRGHHALRHVVAELAVHIGEGVVSRAPQRVSQRTHDDEQQILILQQRQISVVYQHLTDVLLRQLEGSDLLPDEPLRWLGCQIRADP